MSYGLKIFNWVEDAEKDFGGVRSYYEVKEVDDYIRSLKAENKRLQKQYLQAVKAANENIAKNVDGDAEFWKDLCEKSTKMYIGRCDKCGRYDKGVYRIKELDFVCRNCLFKENLERRFNEERSKLG